VSGYTVKETETSSIDLLFGVHYLGIDVETKWDLQLAISKPGGEVLLPAQGKIGDDTDLWDGIGGIRGNFRIRDGKWTVPFYFDVGTGSSDLTWQAMVGVSYAYNFGDLMVMYRHIDYDGGSDDLVEDLSFSGPSFGVRFRFQAAHSFG